MSNEKKKIHANLPKEVGTDRVAYDDSKYLRSTPLCTHQYSNTGDRYAHIRLYIHSRVHRVRETRHARKKVVRSATFGILDVRAKGKWTEILSG